MIEAAAAPLFKDPLALESFIGWAVRRKSAAKHAHEAGATVPVRLPTLQHDRSGLTEKGRMAKPEGAGG